MKLLKHNLEVYMKVMDFLKTREKVCFIQPTGTGKSYVVRKVAESFKHVLYLAPTDYILEQVKKLFQDYTGNITFMTYHALLSLFKKDKECFSEFDFDLIVLDEIHRLGAIKWGEAYEELEKRNPQAKILGLTATETRYLDNERDMAAELFGLENIASYITVSEAWEKGIYLPPTYVIGSPNMEEFIEEAEKLLAGKENTDDYEDKLKKVKLDWIQSRGVSGILERHLRKDIKSIMVFSQTIEESREAEEKVCGWLLEAGFDNIKTYSADSEIEKPLKELKAFIEDKHDGVKVMFSVNMLNEGVHVPGVEAVIFLRSTMSKNVFFQQLGRCMSTNNTKSPIVIDLVDNLHRENFMAGLVSKPHKGGEQKKESMKVGVEIIDTLMEFRQLSEDIDRAFNRHYKTFEENLILLEEFFKENHRPPTKKNPLALYSFYNKHVTDPEVISLIEKYDVKIKKTHTFEENLKLLEKFIKDNHRIPTRRTQAALESFYIKHKTDSEIIALVEKYNVEGVRQHFFEKTLKLLEKFFEENHSLPTKRYPTLCAFYRNHVTDPEVITLVEKYDVKIRKMHTFEENLILLEEFFKENHHIPTNGSYPTLAAFYIKHKTDSRVIKLMEKYIIKVRYYKTFEENLILLEEFFKENHCLPYVNVKGSNSLYAFYRNHKTNPQVIALVEKYLS